MWVCGLGTRSGGYFAASGDQKKLPGGEGGLLPSGVAAIGGALDGVIAADEADVGVDVWAAEVNVGVGDVRDHAVGVGEVGEAAKGGEAEGLWAAVTVEFPEGYVGDR